MTYHYLMDLALILLSTKVLGILTKRIQMPQVVGALVAGLILGPAMLNVLSETEFLTQLSELGVIVLMFSAGMGTDIQELKHSGKAGFLVALLGVIVPLVLGTGLAMLADRTGMIETSGFLEDVFIGTILTATSVSITVETLKEIGKLDTKVGNTILAAALIDDVLGLIALTIVSSLSGGQDSIALVLLKIVLFFVFSAVVSFLAHKFFCWLMALWPGRERRRPAGPPPIPARRRRIDDNSGLTANRARNGEKSPNSEDIVRFGRARCAISKVIFPVTCPYSTGAFSVRLRFA